MIAQLARIRAAAAADLRPLSPTEHLALRIAEGIATIAVAAFACTLSPVGTFVVGLGWAEVLHELARWERRRG